MRTLPGSSLVRLKSAILFLVAVLGIVSVARGLPMSGGEVEFYSDSSRTEWVGTKYWACTGSPHVWTIGQVSNYWIVIDAFSCASEPQQCCWYDGFSQSIECDEC